MTKVRLSGWAAGVVAASVAAAAAWWSFQQAQARHHWHEAKLALELQDANRARAHLAQCLSWWHVRSDVRLLAAQAARLADQFDEAEEHLAFCEQLAAATPDETLRRERALLQVQQGDYRDHLDLLAPNGPTDPQLSADVLDVIAHGYASTFYTAQAVDCLRRLSQFDPEHVRGNLLAGKIYATMRFYGQAIGFFEKAVQRFPDALAPRLELAKCLLELGEVRQAAAHLDALHQRFPDETEVLFAQALIYVYRAQANEAKRVLQQILNSQPDHVDALVELGRLEFRHGDPKDALGWLHKAIAVNPDKIEAWDAQARCHEALSQAEEAERCRQELSRLNRELGEATRLALMATQEKPDDLNLRFETANRFERLHDPVKAVQWRFCTLQLDPAHQPTHRALAQFFERNGQPHRAARHRALGGG